MIDIPSGKKYIDILSGKYHVYDITRMKFIENIMRQILLDNNISNKYLHIMTRIETLSKLYMNANMDSYFIGMLNKYVAASILADFWYTILESDDKYTLDYIRENFPIDKLAYDIKNGINTFDLDDSGYQKRIKWESTCHDDVRKGIRKCIDLDKCQTDIEVEKACRSPYFVTLKEFGAMEPIERIFQLKRELEVLKNIETNIDIYDIEKELETIGTDNLTKLKNMKVRIFRIAKTIPGLIQ